MYLKADQEKHGKGFINGALTWRRCERWLCQRLIVLVAWRGGSPPTPGWQTKDLHLCVCWETVPCVRGMGVMGDARAIPGDATAQF